MPVLHVCAEKHSLCVWILDGKEIKTNIRLSSCLVKKNLTRLSPKPTISSWNRNSSYLIIERKLLLKKLYACFNIYKYLWIGDVRDIIIAKKLSPPLKVTVILLPFKQIFYCFAIKPICFFFTSKLFFYQFIILNLLINFSKITDGY